MLFDIIKNHCCEIDVLSKSDSIKIHRKWLELFAYKVKETTGKWRIGAHLWEGFDSDIQSCYLNNKALEQYRKQKISLFYVFDESGKYCFKCKSNVFPEFFNTGYDLYLLPEDNSWTAAFSHDNAVYFAYADNIANGRLK
jgi:hypothetical protein